VVEARITSKGQITIPKVVRDRLGVGPGDALEFDFEGERLEVRPKRRRTISEFRGLFRVDSARSTDEERRAAWDAMTARLTAPE
jgi:antitoxin PrlF